MFQTLHHWSRDMLNFDFLNKVVGIVSSTHFVYDFLAKIFPLLYSINWPNFIAWLPLLLDILDNICIAIVCYPGYLSNRDVFPTWPKSYDKNLNILRTERVFKIKQKAFFNIFKRLSIKQITQIFLEGENPTLNLNFTFSVYFFRKYFNTIIR